MPAIPALTTVGPGTITAAPHNNNYSTIRTYVNAYCAFIDTAQTWSGAQTFSAAAVFSAGATITGSITLATGVSKIVPGATSLSLRNNADSADNLILTDAGAATFRSTVGGITTLSCTTVTATNLGGTLSTAAQPNVTSFGALTALSIGGNLTFTGASRKVIASATGFSFRDSTDALSWLTFTPSSSVAVGGGSYDVLLGNQSIAANAADGFPRLPIASSAFSGSAAPGVIGIVGQTLMYRSSTGVWRTLTGV